ncbi:MAG: UDP-2,4-diacetamido-2,4,6-trideoxy-beta-L-altropyranose hydrolase [Pirellulales bacterium]
MSLQLIVPTLILRADATSQIGLGHVMRCLALALEWQRQGGRAVMICHCPFEAVRRQIREQGVQLVTLPAPHPAADDVTTTLVTLADLSGGSRATAKRMWVVVDGALFDPSYLTLLRSTGHPVAALDDRIGRPYVDADLIITPAFGAECLEYRAPAGARQMLGIQYALLRPEFLAWREKPRSVPKTAGRLLVTLGGSDPAQATAHVIRALRYLDTVELDVRVVIGPANPQLRSLRLLAIDSRVPVRLVTDCRALPNLMGWADLAISAAGVTCWEMACVGLPNATMATAECQLSIIDAVAHLGAVVPLGLAQNIQPDSLAETISQLLANQSRRQSLLRNSKQLVDGLGANRVVQAMLAAAGFASETMPNDETPMAWPERYHEAA